jgi:protein phosphatase
VQSLVNEGRLTQDQAEHHPQRSLLLQALDGRNEVEPVVLITQPVAGDRYLLCSDGLSDYVPYETIAQALGGGTPDLAADGLVKSALDNGAPDNVTVIVFDVVDDDQPQDAGRRLLGAAARETPAGPPGRPDDDTGEIAPARPPSGPSHAGEDVHGRLLWLVPLVVLLVVGLVGAFGFWRWSQDQWYVGVSDGVVVVYRGLEVETPVIGLHKVVERTDLQAASLPQYELEQVNGGIAAKNRDAAEQTVQRLRDAAQKCLDAPETEGCPT